MTRVYNLHNVKCSRCAARMEKELAALPGVIGAGIDISAARLSLAGIDVPLEEINRVLSGVEFDARAEIPAAASPAGPTALESFDRRTLIQIGFCGLLLVAGLLFEDVLTRMLSPTAAKLLCYGLPYALCGWNVLSNGARSFMRMDFFNEFTLMGGATLAAIAIDQWPEAAGVMIFYRLGEYAQEHAAGKSRGAIRALLAARPSTAHVLEADGVRDAAPESVALDTRVLVRPGEKIPLDGVVISGVSYVDVSPLNGEPLPVRAAPGVQVFAGAVNRDEALTIRVTAAYADSSIARILEMVENAAARKAPTERFITRFARWYTPAVTAGAAATATAAPLLGLGDFSEWLYRALVLLVISCPCALVISIPLGYFGGIGAASRRGILVKGGYVLDALLRVRVAAFDKTGTLTRGVFAVTSILPAPGVEKSALLRCAALAESRSNHPIARAVLLAAQDAGIALTAEVEAREIPGLGMEARSEGRRILAGNAELLRKQGLSAPPPREDERGASVVHVACDGAYLGSIFAADSVRPQTARALEELRGLGIRTLAMLTGDGEDGAVAAARGLPLDVVRSRLLPEDKAAVLQSLGPPEETLFLGDGINDAPALAVAGVGVAMGGLGSEAAIETADAALLDDNLARLPELLRLAARTRNIVRQNIILALSVKTAFMALGVAGLSGLWEAVFADAGVALLAVLNAGRVIRA